MCWWGSWQSKKLSRIQICLFPSVSHIESSISWMVKELSKLSEKLFLMHTFVETTVDDVKKVKS